MEDTAVELKITFLKSEKGRNRSPGERKGSLLEKHQTIKNLKRPLTGTLIFS